AVPAEAEAEVALVRFRAATAGAAGVVAEGVDQVRDQAAVAVDGVDLGQDRALANGHRGGVRGPTGDGYVHTGDGAAAEVATAGPEAGDARRAGTRRVTEGGWGREGPGHGRHVRLRRGPDIEGGLRGARAAAGVRDQLPGPVKRRRLVGELRGGIGAHRGADPGRRRVDADLRLVGEHRLLAGRGDAAGQRRPKGGQLRVQGRAAAADEAVARQDGGDTARVLVGAR